MMSILGVETFSKVSADIPSMMINKTFLTGISIKECGEIQIFHFVIFT
jgi:hypothetical protein